MTVLGWSPETSFYAVAQILTTVGQRLGISRVADLQGGLHVIEGSLGGKPPTIWTDGKAEVGRVKEEKRREEKR